MTPEVSERVNSMLGTIASALPRDSRATYQDMIKAVVALISADEREACARIASGMSDGMDCDNRGAQDPETGEVPCSAETRGEVCVCSERSELAFKIADKIRARSTTTCLGPV